MTPHSVLWIGPASGLEASLLAASPFVDLAWSRELSEALELPLASFDCVVLHSAHPTAPDSLARLRSAGARRVLETPDPARGPSPAELGAERAASPPPRAAPAPAGIVGTSPALRATLALVERARTSVATVLLTGETGTGKEVLARAIHTGSARARAPSSRSTARRSRTRCSRASCSAT